MATAAGDGEGGAAALMSVTVKHGRDAPLQLGVSPRDTVGALKALLAARGAGGGAPARAMRLIAKGKSLDDDAAELGGVLKPGAKLMLLATTGAPPLRAVAGGASKPARPPTKLRKTVPSAAAARPAARALPIAERAKSWAKTGIVSLRDEALDALPAEAFGVGASARVLDAGGNAGIECLMAYDWGSLSKLRTLRLSECALTTAGVPWDALADTLANVQLAHNRLAGVLPASFFCAQRAGALRVLDLSGNALEALPGSIGAMAALAVLRVERNALAELPEELGSCFALEELRAAHNRLCALPASLGRCARLRVLSADGNAALGPAGVPRELLSHATSLHSLTLHGCSVTAEQLRELPGWADFDARRVAQKSAAIFGGGGVRVDDLDEGADVELHRQH